MFFFERKINLKIALNISHLNIFSRSDDILIRSSLNLVESSSRQLNNRNRSCLCGILYQDSHATGSSSRCILDLLSYDPHSGGGRRRRTSAPNLQAAERCYNNEGVASMLRFVLCHPLLAPKVSRDCCDDIEKAGYQYHRDVARVRRIEGMVNMGTTCMQGVKSTIRGGRQKVRSLSL